jgi:hypothetical protein
MFGFIHLHIFWPSLYKKYADPLLNLLGHMYGSTNSMVDLQENDTKHILKNNSYNSKKLDVRII